MIGGTDIVIPAVGDAAALETCARVVQRHWPHVRFEDAETGNKYDRFSDVPLGQVRELCAYTDNKAEAAWDADSPESAPNSMLYFILSPNSVTAVLDDPNTPDMQAILESIRTMMRERILSPDLEEKYLYLEAA
jgi:hypothetical protein